MRQKLPARLFLLSALASAACTGAVGQEPTDDPAATTSTANDPRVPKKPDDSRPVVPPGMVAVVPGPDGGIAKTKDPVVIPKDPIPGAPPNAGPMPLRRLTIDEYNNTIRDLLGDPSAPAQEWAPDVVGEAGFRVGRPTSTKEADDFRQAAVRLASGATGNLDALLACKAGSDETTCMRDFVIRFGRRAYRRPLTAPEIEGLTGLYARLRGAEIALEKRSAVESVLQAMLQNPWFLYRWDSQVRPKLGSNGLIKLDSHTVAARLSYLLWDSMPDADLDRAADAGGLDSPEAVRAQAERMLMSPRAQAPLVAFVSQWLHLDRLRVSSEALGKALKSETDRLVASVLISGDRKIRTLFSTNQAFAEEKLAAIYGVANIKGTDLKPVMLDSRQRMGVLTRANFLIATGDGTNASPPRRGAAIFTGALCGDMPPLPNDVPEPEKPDPKVTTRERFEKHSKNPCATACHLMVDPPGFALGNFDGTGKYRDMEAGKPIDTSGKVPLPDGTELAFRDGTDFMEKISQSATLRNCMVRQWFRNSLSRVETKEDVAALARAQSIAESSDGDIRALILESLMSTPFLYRSLSAGEVLQ